MENQTLTVVERTILANQFRILAKLEDEDADGSNNLKADQLEGGYEWFYSEIIVNEDTKSSEVTVETMDILDMCNTIENAIEDLSPDDRNEIGDDNLERISYKGFDGNRDQHYFVLSMLFRDRRYEEYSKRNNNSHSSITLDTYRRLLAKYKQLKNTMQSLKKSDLQELVNAI